MTWRKVAESPRSVRNIQFGLLIASGLWGLDYALPPTEPGAVLTVVEQKALLPLWVWGTIMALVSVIGTVCELLLNRDSRRWRHLWIGSFFTHATFAAIFAMLAAGSFIGVVLTNEGWYGFRTPVLWALVAGINSAFARRIDGPGRAVL